MSSNINGDVDFGMLPNINVQCHDFAPVTLAEEHMQRVNVVEDDDRIHEYTLLGNLNNMLYVEDDGHQWDGIESLGSIPISELLPPLMWDCAPPLS